MKLFCFLIPHILRIIWTMMMIIVIRLKLNYDRDSFLFGYTI